MRSYKIQIDSNSTLVEFMLVFKPLPHTMNTLMFISSIALNMLPWRIMAAMVYVIQSDSISCCI